MPTGDTDSRPVLGSRQSPKPASVCASSAVFAQSKTAEVCRQLRAAGNRLRAQDTPSCARCVDGQIAAVIISTHVPSSPKAALRIRLLLHRRCLTSTETSEISEINESASLGIQLRQIAHTKSAKTVVCFAVPLTTSFANRIERKRRSAVPGPTSRCVAGVVLRPFRLPEVRYDG